MIPPKPRYLAKHHSVSTCLEERPLQSFRTLLAAARKRDAVRGVILLSKVTHDCLRFPDCKVIIAVIN